MGGLVCVCLGGGGRERLYLVGSNSGSPGSFWFCSTGQWANFSGEAHLVRPMQPLELNLL